MTTMFEVEYKDVRALEESLPNNHYEGASLVLFFGLS
jgi:hypothetical protein